MCGRYTLATYQDQLATEFDLIEIADLTPRYNIAPTQMAPVVRVLEGDTRRHWTDMRWGLIPHWAKDPAIDNRMINARSEEAASKPSFRVPLRRQRCLVPATGFYEWKPTEEKVKGKVRKQPHYIRRKDEGVFAFAGLWERWKDPDGEPIESYTILTTEPNKLLKALHNRMPVIIPPDEYDLWLDPTMQDVEKLASLFKPFPDKQLTAFPVSLHVNSPAHDDPSCIKAAS